MKRPLHIFALFLFALTQCIAPFAHAHVDGMQGSASLHVSDTPHPVAFAGVSHCHIESYDSPAVSVQQEYQRDDASVIPGIPASSMHPLSRDITTCALDAYDALHSLAFAYHRPHPHAPPA